MSSELPRRSDDIRRDWTVPVIEPGMKRPSIFTIDAAHLERQRKFSANTFGPGTREAGVLDHIRKELVEIEDADQADKLTEWVDVIILAFDGAWRSGAEPQAILDAIRDKQARNEGRSWPDWRTAPAGAAIEHHRSCDEERAA